ncbi:MAG: DEAD/DEAH box helicase family protein [Alphaproteobacteria bacterium]|nr:DEAD/DEAH box helicase family protein [Alphaproteobacteria bacterium]
MLQAPLPQPGQVVHVRQRRWLVSDVVPGEGLYQSALVRLSCLDDDNAGESAEVLWAHEIDAALVPDTPELVKPGVTLDDPKMFGAYLHALRWHSVTSTDHRLLQAPFRAGIDTKPYQLEPLRKALALPRVNLFIADDVGLGKTIEAGLVMQELLLRQRIDRILVVCPPAITRQWQEELEQRFGLSFAVYDREYVSARRRERGFGVNPWTTHRRFIVSYTLLRGTKSRSGRGAQHLELLLSALGDRAERSLLILDECHQVAPSSGSLYPADSRTTQAIREIAHRFEHRLFLSATPHNGHSSSFSSLLHLLDPQRFTRGVRIESAKELAPVMVRRLKRHLRGEVPGLPKRVLVDHVTDVPADAPEVELGTLLAAYDAAYRATLKNLSKREAAARGLVVVNLHKRLLSSLTAFHHTLQLHARGAKRALAEVRQLTLAPPPPRDGELDEDAQDEAEDTFVETQAFDAGAEARALLDRMLDLSAKHKAQPDARVRALAAWVNEQLIAGGQWGDRRVVVFTEYQHTLSWLRRVLPSLLDADATDRIGSYTGQLSEDKREALKRAFNTAPGAHPLRVLLATDAAREGINLQAHCADLFHFDLPWNPSRIEQRNGRIDRVLQPSDEVRCHYFVVPQRPEDRVLAYLVKKNETIREELGSLSEVISARLAAQIESDLRSTTPDDLDRLATPEDAARRARAELEGDGADQLRGDLEVLRRQLERSQKAVDYHADHLKAVVDLGLRLLVPGGTGPGLQPVQPETNPPQYELPPLDSSWAGVLDPMREKVAEPDPRHPPPVRPVAFRAAHKLDADTVQLHLGHPLVKRLVARFRAQGFAAHDLSRVTAVSNPRDASRRVVLFGRLALFGHGATRLHEEILAVAARVTEAGLEPFAGTGEETTIAWLDEALAQGPQPVEDRLQRSRLCQRAPTDAQSLWTRLEAKALEAEGKARTALDERGRKEADAMTELLQRQRASIQQAFDTQREVEGLLLLDKGTKEEKAQFERDKRAMEGRLADIATELDREPKAIRRSYSVVLRRFEPIGLAYLWPES